MLKRALFLASFASLSSPESRAYYDKKRAERSATTPPSSASPAVVSMSTSLPGLTA